MEITGRCKKIEGFDKETGIQNFRFYDYGSRTEFLASGITSMVVQDGQYRLNGEYDDNRVFHFNEIMQAVNCRNEAIDMLVGMTGLREPLAAEVIGKLGDDIFSYPQRKDFMEQLLSIPGIGEKRAIAVKEALQNASERDELFRTLVGNGIPANIAMALSREQGKDALRMVECEPYSLLKYDVPFETCDGIAMRIGMDCWDFKRIHALIKSGMDAFRISGHTRMELSAFIKRASAFEEKHGAYEVRVPEELIEITVFSAPYAKIYKEDGKDYLSPMDLYDHEKKIVQNIARLQHSTVSFSRESLCQIIHEIEIEQKLTYNREQREAFNCILTGGISLLTGGPGSGKTTTINGIVKAYQRLCPAGRINDMRQEETVLMCAPTGRAASRMAEISKKKAQTIHKALNLRWFNKEKRAEPLKETFIIVDEMSMCDTEVFSLFLQSVVSGTTILLVGDDNQLPSVGPGQVFRDLISSGRLPLYVLKENKRQGDGSLIAENANRILNDQPLVDGENFHICRFQSDEKLSEYLNNIEINDGIQILCPIKKGAAGTGAINDAIQKSMGNTNHGTWINGRQFFEGDRIMMNANNYEENYMNGDIGKLMSSRDGFVEISFVDKCLHLEVSGIGDVSLAYALTVHKSQGAECDTAIIALPEASLPMASREILYTAVTRAKKTVILCTIDGVLEKYQRAILRNKRSCGLCKMLQNALPIYQT